MTVTGLHHLTQLTGCTHPSAGAGTFPVGLVTGCSVLTQAALQTVSSIKPRRAFWEKTYRKEKVFHLSIICVCALGFFFFVYIHLLCSWVQSNLACTRTVHWPGGRCRCYGSYRSGYTLPRRNRAGMLPERDNNTVTSA